MSSMPTASMEEQLISSRSKSEMSLMSLRIIFVKATGKFKIENSHPANLTNLKTHPLISLNIGASFLRPYNKYATTN